MKKPEAPSRILKHRLQMKGGLQGCVPGYLFVRVCAQEHMHVCACICLVHLSVCVSAGVWQAERHPSHQRWLESVFACMHSLKLHVKESSAESNVMRSLNSHMLAVQTLLQTHSH